MASSRTPEIASRAAASGRTRPGERAALQSRLAVELDLREEETRIGAVLGWLIRELSAPGIFVVPLRLFIGIGWLRAALEKAVDAGWYNGAALRSFLDQQAGADAFAFGSYEWLSGNVWHVIAMPLGWAIVVAQLVIGVAILVGAFTNLALLAGILLNVNFMLAGAISPSAFYIVIQITILAMGAGAVFGVDQRWRRTDRSALLVARKGGLLGPQRDRWWIGGLSLTFGVAAAVAGQQAKDLSPSGVEDPALVLAVVMLVCALTMTLALVRDLVGQGELAGP